MRFSFYPHGASHWVEKTEHWASQGKPQWEADVLGSTWVVLIMSSVGVVGKRWPGWAGGSRKPGGGPQSVSLKELRLEYKVGVKVRRMGVSVSSNFKCHFSLWASFLIHKIIKVIPAFPVCVRIVVEIKWDDSCEKALCKWHSGFKLPFAVESLWDKGFVLIHLSHVNEIVLFNQRCFMKVMIKCKGKRSRNCF